MKMLASSADLDDLALVVKWLISAGIPCAVCRDSVNYDLSVWVQRDADFPRALGVASSRPGRPRLPHWVTVLEFAQPATEGSALPVTKRKATAPGPFVQIQLPSRTETAHGTTDAEGAGMASRLGPNPDTAAQPAVDTTDVLRLESMSRRAEGQRLQPV
jgi:hypothetical protein